MPQNASDELPPVSVAEGEGVRLDNLSQKISEWTKILRGGSTLVAERGPDEEPYKNIYTAIENVTRLRNEVDQLVKENFPNKVVSFYVNFALIHIRSSLAKWLESCDELSQAEEEHIL